MNKCPIPDIKELTSRLTNICREYFKNAPDKDQVFKQKIRKFLLLMYEKYLSTASAQGQTVDLIEESIRLLEKYKMTAFDSLTLFITKENFENIISGTEIVGLNNNAFGGSQLIDASETQRRILANHKFLDDAYGDALEAELYARLLMNRSIVDACFINRGSINVPFGNIKSVTDLNRNIRTLLEQLLNTIYDYFNNYIINGREKIVQDRELREIIRSRKSLYKDNNYTGVLELLEEVLNQFLYISPDNLKVLYNAAFSGNELAKARLDAYNAAIMLKNFDTYLDMYFGRALEIKYFERKFAADDKYSFKGKTVKTATSWLNENVVDMEAIADVITKSLINTTPFYRYGSLIPIPNKYLQYGQFQHVIGKIKLLGTKSFAKYIKFDDQFQNQYKEFWDSLSDFTKYIISGKTLAEVINSIRYSPRYYTLSIFEILANPALKNDDFKSLHRYFTNDERDFIYSSYLGIFHPTANSVYNLTNSTDSYDFYSYITLEVDRIFDVYHMLYYMSDGLVSINSLMDYAVYRIQQNIESSINDRHNVMLGGFDRLAEKYTISEFTENNLFSGIIILDGSGLNIKVYKNGSVIITDDSGTVDYYKFNNLEFIDDVLGLDLSRNPLIYEELLYLYFENKAKANLALLNLTARVLLNSYISKNKLDYSSTNSLEKSWQSIGMTTDIPLNYIHLLSLVNTQDFITLTALARSKAIVNGMFNSTLTRDGSGKSQNALVNSRLLGSFPTLFELLNKKGRYNRRKQQLIRSLNNPNLTDEQRTQILTELALIPDSATANCVLLNDYDLLVGIYTLKEYKADKALDSTDMTVRHLAYCDFLYDYIGGLVAKGANARRSYEILGDGIVAFYASVNSDKNTVGRLAINLKRLVSRDLTRAYPSLFRHGDGRIKQYDELSQTELETVIEYEFSNIYSSIYKAIEYDWYRLFNFINSYGVYNPITFNNQSLYNFSDFSSWFHIEKELGHIPSNLTEVQFIKQQVSLYNKQNPNLIIEMIDLVHYVEDSGYLLPNQTLLSNLVRWDTKGIFSKLNPGASLKHLKHMYLSSEDFWIAKEFEVLDSLLNCNFSINLDGASLEANELKKILGEGSNWIGKDNYLVLGKANLNGVIYNISTKADLLYVKEVAIASGTIVNYELNPLISLYNLYDYLFTQEWMISTVGSLIAHPSKLKIKELANNKVKIKYGELAVRGLLFNGYLFRLSNNPSLGYDLIEMIEQNGSFQGRYYLNLVEQLTDIQLHDLISNIAKTLKIGQSIEIDGDIPAGMLNLLKELGFYRTLYPTQNGIRARFTKKSKSLTTGERVSTTYTEEALRFKALDKRNVNYTATMNPFELGLFDGIPSLYNMAVIEDIYEVLGIVHGTNEKIKPFDGATFVNPFIVHLENNSLRGALAGITKKQFAHFYNLDTGTGGTLKTAGFGLTNDWIRNSKYLLHMMKKMTRGKWRVPAEFDFIKDFNGNTIRFEPIYVKEKGQYYQIEILGKTPNGEYNVKRTKVTREGTVVGNAIEYTVLVQSNYDLWQLFGGANSMEINPSSGKLEFSESSIRNVVLAMNQASIRMPQAYDLTIIVKHNGEYINLYQPLKYSDIHYLATAGAVKQGAANINSNKLFDLDNDEDFAHLVIKLYQIGILLDKEHHADEAELSLLTLVINACALKGYTFEAALKLYNALATLTDVGISDYMDKTGVFVSPDEFREITLRNVIKNIDANASYKSLLNNIARELVRKSNEDEFKFSDLSIPVSDKSMYRRLISSLNTMFTKAGIKQKIPGILAVLTPSCLIMKLYNGKKLEHYDDFESEIFTVQNGSTVVEDLRELSVGKTYLILQIGAKNSLSTASGALDLASLINDNGTVNWELFNSTFTNYFNTAPIELFSRGTRETLNNRPEHHPGELFTIDHIRNVVSSASALEVPAHLKKPLILAALLHDIAKPFHNTDHGGDAINIINTLFADSPLLNIVKLAVKHHMFSPTQGKFTLDYADIMITEAIQNNVNVEDFIDLILALNVADILSGRDWYTLEENERLVDIISKENLDKRKLLTNSKFKFLKRVHLGNDTDLFNLAQQITGNEIIYELNTNYSVDLSLFEQEGKPTISVSDLIDSNEILVGEESAWESVPITSNLIEIHLGYWTREEAAANPDKIYVFGDNLEDALNGYVPRSTQAVIRGLPNAIGISTKKNRGTNGLSLGEISYNKSFSEGFYLAIGSFARANRSTNDSEYESIVDSFIEKFKKDLEEKQINLEAYKKGALEGKLFIHSLGYKSHLDQGYLDSIKVLIYMDLDNFLGFLKYISLAEGISKIKNSDNLEEMVIPYAIAKGFKENYSNILNAVEREIEDSGLSEYQKDVKGYKVPKYIWQILLYIKNNYPNIIETDLIDVLNISDTGIQTYKKIIDVLNKYQNTESSYFSDDDFEQFRTELAKLYRLIIRAINEGKTIVLPEGGIGTGKALLDTRSPKAYEALTKAIEAIKLYATLRQASPLIKAQNILNIIRLAIKEGKSIVVPQSILSDPNILSLMQEFLTKALLYIETVPGRISLEAIREGMNLLSTIELGRTYIIKLFDEKSGLWITKSELIYAPTDYFRLKELMSKGYIESIQEDKTVGRELAGYNCRYTSIDGRKFLLWDLDSVRWLYIANENKNNKGLLLQIAHLAFPELTITETSFSSLETLLRRLILRDVYNLSKSSLDILKLYETLLTQRNNPNFYKRYTNIVNILLGTYNGNVLKINGIDIVPSDLNFDLVDSYVRQQIVNHTKVSINGELVEIDKNSVLVQPYEIIMPKRFAKVFGLDTFVDLDDVVNNENYFVEQLLSHQTIKVDNEDHYTMAFKLSNGRHYYVLDRSQASNLPRMYSEIETFEEDGTIFVLDSDGNKLYPLYSYTDSEGKLVVDKVLRSGDAEIILTDNIEFYIDRLRYNSILFSDKISDLTLNRVIRYMEYNPKEAAEDNNYSSKHTKNRIARKLFDLFCPYIEFNYDPNDPLTDEEFKMLRFIWANGNSKEQLIQLLEETKWDYRYRFSTANLEKILNYINFITEVINQYDTLIYRLNTTGASRNSIFCRDTNIDAVRQRNKFINSVTVSNYRDPKYLEVVNYFIKLGKLKHAAFLKSLEIIAARIPSQCLLSVMPMKCVAFENQDVNNAYVSTYLILLQGSDFDIDAVSLETFDIDIDGIFEVASPYGVLDTKEGIDASLHLPFPTGIYANLPKVSPENLIKNRENWNLFIRKYFGTILHPRLEYKNGEPRIVLDHTIEDIDDLNLFVQLLEDFPKLLLPRAAEMDIVAREWQRYVPDIPLRADLAWQIILQIGKFIDNHNMYLLNVDNDLMVTISNNITTQSIYDISGDIVNILQAQIPVDAITEPLREVSRASLESKRLENATPGNFMNKNESFTSNMLGTDDIGICAVGLKVFGALTHYFNWVLNNGTKEQQSRLLVGKFNLLLANVRALDPNSILDDVVLESLSSNPNDNDVSLTLSALISLSADNAKELVLSKLNADSRLIGIYLYGTMLDMPFDKIAKLLMSDSGSRVVELLLTHELGSNLATLDNIFKTLLSDKVDIIPRFIKDCVNDYTGVLTLLLSDRQLIDNLLVKNLATILNTLVTSNQVGYLYKIKILDDCLIALENFRKSQGAVVDPKTYQYFRELKEFIRLRSNLNEDTIKTLKYLYEGAEETRILGAILGLNQGLKSGEKESMTQLLNFSTCLVERKRRLDKNYVFDESDLIDVRRFIEDESYRQKCISEYEDVKHSFNILEVVATVPHYFKYLTTLAGATYGKLLISYKYRSKEILASRLAGSNPYLAKDKLISGIDRYVNNAMINEWLRSRNIQIPITRGFATFGRGIDLPAIVKGVSRMVVLGNDAGNLSFKQYFELKILDDLRHGTNVGKWGLLVRDNIFIQGLTSVTNNLTLSHNPEGMIGLDINMSPENEQELQLLDKYMAAFQQLAPVEYEFKYTVLLDGKLVEVTSHMSLIDLFTYYSMIVNEWTPGLRSLRKIFEPFEDRGAISEFYLYIDRLDKTQDYLEDNGDLIRYVAPVGGRLKSRYTWDAASRAYKFIKEGETITQTGGKGFEEKVLTKTMNMSVRIDNTEYNIQLTCNLDLAGGTIRVEDIKGLPDTVNVQDVISRIGRVLNGNKKVIVDKSHNFRSDLIIPILNDILNAC